MSSKAHVAKTIRCLLKLFSRILESAVSSDLELVNLTVKLDQLRCPMYDLLTSEGQKLHPQILLSTPNYDHPSHEEAGNSDMPV